MKEEPNWDREDKFSQSRTVPFNMNTEPRRAGKRTGSATHGRCSHRDKLRLGSQGQPLNVMMFEQINAGRITVL